jgi:serine/threonine protein kinase
MGCCESCLGNHKLGREKGGYQGIKSGSLSAQTVDPAQQESRAVAPKAPQPQPPTKVPAKVAVAPASYGAVANHMVLPHPTPTVGAAWRGGGGVQPPRGGPVVLPPAQAHTKHQMHQVQVSQQYAGRGIGVSAGTGAPAASTTAAGARMAVRGGAEGWGQYIPRGGHIVAATATTQPVASLRTKYEMLEVLGVGSTSTCYRCTEKATGHAYACKVIDKRVIEHKFSGLLEQFHVEIAVLRLLRHPNIVHLQDVFETDRNIQMVLELMEGGEVFDYVVDRGTLSEGEAAGMVRQVTSALAYMHSMDVIHRDLKPENLLLARRDVTADIKIIDFGLAKILEQKSKATSFLGTRGYLAPEMLQRKAYDHAVDAWALGIIVFVLVCGCLPFDDDSARINQAGAVSKFVLRFPRWAQNLSREGKDLLRRLLDVNPATRMKPSEAMEHPWLAGKGQQKKNLLDSPRALKQLPKMGSPKETYGGGKASVAEQRQADFAAQSRDYAPNGKGAVMRKNSI